MTNFARAAGGGARLLSRALLCGLPLVLTGTSSAVVAAPAGAKSPSRTATPVRKPAAPAGASGAAAGAAKAAPKPAADAADALAVSQPPPAAPAGAAPPASASEALRDIQLQPDQSQILEFPRLINQVAVVNPAVADVTLVGPSTMVLTAKAAGETLLFINHGAGRSVFRITVTPPPTPDLAQVASQIEAGINRPGVTVRALGKNVLVEGEVANQAELNRIAAILRAFNVEAQNLVTVRPGPPAPPPPPADETAAEAVRNALNLPNITVRPLGNNRIALEGRVRSATEAERIRRVVSAVATGVEVVDLLTIPAPEAPTKRQVLIRARVIEISKSRTRDLGFDWGPVAFTPGTDTSPPSFTIGDQPFLFGQTQPGPFDSLFGGGPIQRLQPVGFKLTTLLREGAARVLAEPNLTVLEGGRGTILIGGEYPYPTVQAGSAVSGGVAPVTIAFKPFGISLAVEPQEITEDEVTLRLAPEVSNLDFRNAVIVSGFTLPTLQSRRAETLVRIQNGQPLAIGGMLRDVYSKAEKNVGGFEGIPVLGELFKSRSFQRDETELVILVTPEILGPGQAPSTPVPATEIARPPIPTPKVR